jgi:hypothetical protein
MITPSPTVGLPPLAVKANMSQRQKQSNRAIRVILVPLSAHYGG